MAETPDEPRALLAAFGPGTCDCCLKAFSRGAGVGNADGELLVALCIWCLLTLADDATGHNHFGQELIWNTRKRYYRRIKELGWSGKASRWKPRGFR